MSGALGTYYPDFVLVQKKGRKLHNWIIETKGQEDVEVAAKDEQMERWCSEVSAETGVPWSYAKVAYRVFHDQHLGSFDDLLKILAGEAGQLVLPVEGGDTMVLSDPPSRPLPEAVQCFWKTFGGRVPTHAIVLASTVEWIQRPSGTPSKSLLRWKLFRSTRFSSL